MGSETTAAATGQVGVVRRDPMAMLPFCGYNMGDYFAPLARDAAAQLAEPAADLQRQLVPHATTNGKFLWPGFGENMRVLQVDRRPRATARPSRVETPLGWMPRYEDI